MVFEFIQLLVKLVLNKEHVTESLFPWLNLHLFGFFSISNRGFFASFSQIMRVSSSSTVLSADMSFRILDSGESMDSLLNLGDEQ